MSATTFKHYAPGYGFRVIRLTGNAQALSKYYIVTYQQIVMEHVVTLSPTDVVLFDGWMAYAPGGRAQG